MIILTNQYEKVCVHQCLRALLHGISQRKEAKGAPSTAKQSTKKNERGFAQTHWRSARVLGLGPVPVAAVAAESSLSGRVLSFSQRGHGESWGFSPPGVARPQQNAQVPTNPLGLREIRNSSQITRKFYAKLRSEDSKTEHRNCEILRKGTPSSSTTPHKERLAYREPAAKACAPKPNQSLNFANAEPSKAGRWERDRRRAKGSWRDRANNKRLAFPLPHNGQPYITFPIFPSFGTTSKRLCEFL